MIEYIKQFIYIIVQNDFRNNIKELLYNNKENCIEVIKIIDGDNL